MIVTKPSKDFFPSGIKNKRRPALLNGKGVTMSQIINTANWII